MDADAKKPDTHLALFAAGGTGGHIWPAVAVARALAKADSTWECRFIAGDRPVETEVYRAAEIAPIVFHVPPPSGGRWRTWLAMGPALLRARKLIKQWKPSVAVCTGGYVSAPVALAATMLGVPTIMVEPNAIPGRVTRKLAKRVDVIALADPTAKEHLAQAKRCEVTGIPLMWSRDDLNRANARRELGVDDDALCLLIVGGSQGARKLNSLIGDVLNRWRESPPGRKVHLIWIAGSGNVDEVRRAQGDSSHDNVKVDIHGHVWPLTNSYAAADLVISRAGAGTVAEIAVAGVPSILLPLPIALDDHQRINARRLVEQGAARIFDERIEKAPQLDALLSELIADDDRLSHMASAARDQSLGNAAVKVAELAMAISRT